MGMAYHMMLPDESIPEWEGIVQKSRQILGAAPSRWPTLLEVRSVLDGFDGFEVEYVVSDKSWEARVRADHPKSVGAYADIVARRYSGREGDPCPFFFDRGTPALNLAIAQAVTQLCGPLLLVPSEIGLPLVVYPSLDFEAGLRFMEGG